MYRRRYHYVSTEFQLELTASYKKLVALFGFPTKDPHEKTQYQWDIETVEGTSPVSIYDYYAPMSPAITDTYAWHIGAQTREDAEKFVNWFKHMLYSLQI